MNKLIQYIKQQPKKFAVETIGFILMTLWIVIGSKKIFAYGEFRQAMLEQLFSDDLGMFLSYTLPVIEVCTGLLFIFDKTRIYGLWLSIVLMALFSGYVILALLNTWGAIPCGCVLEFKISWHAHLWINGFITSLCIAGLILEKNIKSSKTNRL